MILAHLPKSFREWIVAVLQLLPCQKFILLTNGSRWRFLGRFWVRQQVVGRITGFFTGVYLNHRGFKSQGTPIGSQPQKQKKHLEVSSRTQCTSKTQGTLAVKGQPCPSKDFSYPFHPWKMTIISSSKSLLHINSSSVLHVRRVFEVDDVHGRTDPLSDRKFWDINQAVRHLSVLSCRVNKKEPFTSLNQTFLRLPHTKYNF